MTQVFSHGELYREWDWRGLFQDRLAQVAQGRDLHIYGMGGFPNIHPDEDRSFNVFLYSAPYPEGTQKLRFVPTVATMFGIPVEKREESLPPAYCGYVIHCPEGVPVAECLEDRAIYFFHNIGCGYENSEFEIAHRVLDQYLAHRACSEEEQLRRAASWQSYLQGQFASWYPETGNISAERIELCGLLSARAAASLREPLSSAVSLAFRYQLASQVDNAEFCQKLLLELEQIRCLAQVQDVEVDFRSSSLVIYTKPLYCLNPKTGKRYLIGRMQIHLNLLNSEVTWINQDRHVNGCQAPGVGLAGEPLYERLILQFAGMLPTFELHSAAKLAIQYVEKIPPGVWWADSIELWPLCEEEGS